MLLLHNTVPQRPELASGFTLLEFLQNVYITEVGTRRYSLHPACSSKSRKQSYNSCHGSQRSVYHDWDERRGRVAAQLFADPCKMRLKLGWHGPFSHSIRFPLTAAGTILSAPLVH